MTPPVPCFGEALRFWSKLGWISFGGPAGQIAIMHKEIVERRRWLSERSKVGVIPTLASCAGARDDLEAGVLRILFIREPKL